MIQFLQFDFSSLSDEELLSAYGIGVICVILFFYFIPSIIALLRGKNNLLAIMALNFFLGWSVIGWVISLVWSLSSDAKPGKVIINQSSPRGEDNVDKLAKLKKLMDEGAITHKEFEQQKSVLLKK